MDELVFEVEYGAWSGVVVFEDRQALLEAIDYELEIAEQNGEAELDWSFKITTKWMTREEIDALPEREWD